MYTLYKGYRLDSSVDLHFCYRLLHKTVDEPDLLCCVLWTDEATFSRSGVTSLHNLNEWAGTGESSCCSVLFSKDITLVFELESLTVA
jgi:hypothetical protein